MSPQQPPPPPGFVVEGNPLDQQAETSSLPAGFVPIHNPVGYEAPDMAPDVSPTEIAARTVGNDAREVGSTLAGLGEDVGASVINSITAVPNSAIDIGARAFGDTSAPQIPAVPVGSAGKAVNRAIGSAPIGGAESAGAVMGGPFGGGALPPDVTPSSPTPGTVTASGFARNAAQTAANVDQEIGRRSPLAADILESTGHVAGDVLNVLPAEGALAFGARDLERAAADSALNAGRAAPTAEENLAAQFSASRGNMGAAVSPPSLEGASPGLRQAVANSTNIDPEALTRQLEADTLPQPEGVSPISLRAGSASANDQQISLERNLRADPATQGLLAKSIADNDAKLGSSLGEIRRRATPEIVQRSNLEHGQTAIDAIKSRDNAAILDTRAKYKALADANGGSMPLDTSATVGGIKGALSKAYLTKTAAENPVISEVMDGLNSSEPMTFEQFENARTNLAAVQRGSDSNAARAAAIVRGGLEDMPLSGDAKNLKSMADSARAAARTRFNTIEQNPAYQAAVHDNVPMSPEGLHIIGAPSPLADSFMDRYFLGNGQTASRAYISRIQGVMQSDPDFARSVEASSLNRLRQAAGLNEADEGPFKVASYAKARDAMAPKADVLMSPQSAAWTDQLKRVAGYENGVGKAGTVNYSNTAPALQQISTGEVPSFGAAAAKEAASHATDILAAHTPGGIGLLGKRVGMSMLKSAREAKIAAAKLKFAQEATRAGAGIDRGAAATAGSRASGGRVDHEVLVSRLMNRWHAARKEASKRTEPLLNFSDDTIQKALQIVGRSPI